MQKGNMDYNYNTRSKKSKVNPIQRKKSNVQSKTCSKNEEDIKRMEEGKRVYYTRSKTPFKYKCLSRETNFIKNMKTMLDNHTYKVKGVANKIYNFNNIMEYCFQHIDIIMKPKNNVFKEVIGKKLVQFYKEDKVEIANDWHCVIFGEYISD